MAEIYERLGLPGFDRFEPRLRGYLESITDYKKNRFDSLPPETRRRVAEAWRRSFEEWGYSA